MDIEITILHSQISDLIFVEYRYQKVQMGGDNYKILNCHTNYICKHIETGSGNDTE